MKKWLYIGGVLVLIPVLWFAYYAISPIFHVVHMDEALPTEDAVPAQPQASLSEGAAGEVTGTFGHPASGTAHLVSVGGKQFVRYENFKTINGPDIFVYLSKDLDAKEFVNIGEVRATEGNINYEVPEGVDASQYPYVLIWCRQFHVLFNYAKIN